MLRFIVTTSLLLFFISPALLSAEVVESGVTYSETTTVNGETYVLNGTGTRKATIFRVRVYAAGLYLKEKSNSPEEIISQTSPSYLRMEFVRDVEREKFVEGFEEGIEDNNENIDELIEPLKEFNSYMRDVKDGDLAELTFYPGVKVVGKIGQGDPFEVVNKALPTALLRVWLGEEPPNESLKEGLLGR